MSLGYITQKLILNKHGPIKPPIKDLQNTKSVYQEKLIEPVMEYEHT